ncbi:MAG: hypothetical protein UV57_C0042G0007 [Parcubacteria group bacterium GW2011_GWD2_43_10]|nr:MAG: hypothetical protein UV57_C0042G0007 [Parcubacteria group bacterium GW2011_GWD2_43_10]OHA55687.1 MAG: hypothetical protein A2429_02295 [Candidatus Veblenbacteria bacterium RIFOXYC1_FULL_42_9]OHA56886.1 MAG: hypothetical protein A2588_03585 [Candidatus Veblenbacteria bacterium RIFOXYD1_FULL_43_11]
MAKSKVGVSTVSFLDIAEVREDCVIMRDGTLRGVLLCSSVNFALKSEDEQTATIQAYMQFLNSIDFPLQIVIQSRKLNIDGYLEKLKVIEKQQTNELLRVQIADYLDYIKELISLGEIMTKRFYLIAPYNPQSDKRRNFFQRLLSILAAAGTVKLSRDEFERYAEALGKRMEFLISGLASTGLTAVRLDTQGLIELYYNSYNPELGEQQPLASLEKIQVEAAAPLAEGDTKKKN